MWKQSMLLALLGSALLLTFSACEDDPVDRKDSDVALSFEYEVDGQDFNYEQVYDINGVATKFYAVQFYLGGMEFKPSSGDAVSVSDYLLVKPGMTTDALVTLDKGDYDQLNFFIGVAPEDNDQTENDFTSRPADDPLAPQPSDQPQMHWNWNTGYIFFRIDGEVDTDGDGTPETAMEYHVGTNNFRTDISLNLSKEIRDDATMLSIGLDVAKLFNGLDLATESISHTGDFPQRARTFADNWPAAISLK
jgi:hypothetical protein